ncbi:LysR family transcriptional regulator [Amycolatopsis panacis]|uniref:LysR family transcriptional regulator n=1 Tax=Amycolatopsis panacis TaxID=2340917 RepID=A0A419HJE8_9PSEU|nr:LysR family transcriptional regulator [Amycolatopsis panacis]RJQ75922.1 LysR family transcriptional regulator [Amycolatopsis panacis]
MTSADGLRYFLQVAKRGRLTVAADALGVDHTTVGRQVGKLERALGHRLFDRNPSGWTLTEAGHRLLPHAEAVEAAVTAASGLGAAGTGQLDGTIRIATPDAFGAFLLAPGLGPLRDRHPRLDVQIVTSTRNVPLGMREFDVAVTLEEPRRRHALYCKLTDYILGFYASRSYLAEKGPVERRKDLRDQTLIWYVDDLLDIAPLRLLNELLPDQRVSIQANSVTGHWQAAVAGLGIALLPRYLGSQDRRLVPVLSHDLTFSRSYWLAVPRELARLDRVRAVVDVLEEIVAARHHDLLGALGTPPAPGTLRRTLGLGSLPHTERTSSS